MINRYENESEREYYARLAGYARDVWDERNENPKAMDLIQAINSKFLEWNKLKAYIYQYCKQYYPTYFVNNKEDMINEIFVELFNNIRFYNGTIDITTFAKRHIKHGCSVFISYVGKKSLYYNENYAKIKKVIAKILANNEEAKEEDITDGRIMMELPNLSIKQIHTAREINNYSVQAFDDSYVAVSFETPEKAYENNRRRQLLTSAMQELTYVQQIILSTDVGLSPIAGVNNFDDLSYNEEFLAIVKRENLGHLIEIDKNNREYISKDKIKILYKQTLRIARNVPAVSIEINRHDDKQFREVEKEAALTFSNEQDALETELAFMEN